MKLKKLLPLASVAGVTAIVAPLATSCTTSSAIKYDFKMTQKTSELYTIGEYKPEFKQIAQPTKAITFKDGQQMYYDDIAANPSIIADDVMNNWVAYVNNYINDAPLGVRPYHALEGSLEISIDNWDSANRLLSVTVKNHYKFQGLYISQLVTMDHGTVDSVVTIKNMPFYLAPEFDEETVYFCPEAWGYDDLATLAWLAQDTTSGWSMEWNETWTVNDDNIGVGHHAYWDHTNPTDEVYTVAGEYVNAAEALSTWSYLGVNPYHWDLIRQKLIQG